MKTEYYIPIENLDVASRFFQRIYDRMYRYYDGTKSWSPQQREKARRELEQKKYYDKLNASEEDRLRDIKDEMKRNNEEYIRL